MFDWAERPGIGFGRSASRAPGVSAVPAVGLLALTASGVVAGCRQANPQRYLRSDAARTLQ